jgi:hypothetical protein
LNYKVSTQLLRGAKTKEAREEEKQYIIHNKRLLDKVGKVMQDKYNDSLREMRAEKNYDLAAWPQFQADQLGYQRALVEMLAIITLTGDDNE